MTRSRPTYPPSWPTLAPAIKAKANWTCVRCHHPHSPRTGHTLTVHHLDRNPNNIAWWNLPPLCQRCHLRIQAKVRMHQIWPLEHSEWFKPYAAGYYAHCNHLPEYETYVFANIDFLLSLAS